jgi:uncharacterized protein YndB with AHSA1/START domain
VRNDVTAKTEDMTVQKSIDVEVDRQRAFSVFTEGFDTWWLRSHHIGAAELQEAVIEPREGGRWYEKGVDGSECDWGYVIAWEPPGRVVLAWQLDAQWNYDPGLVTEIEVRFTEVAANRTRVDFEHRYIDRMGAAAAEARAALGSDGGWPGLLQRFVAQAEAGQD